ncbi:hydroxymethylglutaryl-CoA reductase, degradative [Candidatus Bathyarchaeota archaeon]|nr:hydroxymethylglutaryl-CoA reductase, degradative [Candidatus Bathyarchaeota archaeon]
MMPSEFSSRISGFYKKPVEERIKIVAEKCELNDEDIAVLKSDGGLSIDAADHMTENVIGSIAYPFSVAVNFRVNGKDYLVPMAGEEPSVVAAASNMARLMREDRGIVATATDPVMIGQIQVLDIPDMDEAIQKINDNKKMLIEAANELDPILVKFGGGAKDIELRPIETAVGPMLIVHLLVDCRDAMGANAVNTMVETLAPTIAELTGGRCLLRIISNLADRRLVTVKCRVKSDDIGGPEAVDKIVAAWAFADADPYRAATHNKGIMNGIAAVALAFAQDHRAIEAGAHSYAVRDGQYRSMSKWSKADNGDLLGEMTLPMAVGLVGGATRSHPMAQIARKILGVDKAVELGKIMCAVGLAQNLGALRALTQEGIQEGHMKLHARNLVVMAGAKDEMIEKAVNELVESGEIRFPKAQEIVKRLQR